MVTVEERVLDALVFFRPTPKLSVAHTSSMMVRIFVRSSSPGMSRRTALLPQAISKPTPDGLIASL
jgi:hypothetical protein